MSTLELIKLQNEHKDNFYTMTEDYLEKEQREQDAAKRRQWKKNDFKHFNFTSIQ